MKITFIFLVFIVVGCTKNRDVTSESAKWQKLTQKTKAHSHTHSHGKARAVLQSDISVLESKDGSLKLTAHIMPFKDIHNIEIEWKLPEHVHILQGSQRGSIDISEKSNQKQILSIEKDSLKEGDRIFFFAYQMKEGERVGSSAQYHHTQQPAQKKQLNFKKFSEERKRKIIQ